jgi:hypothetical protein
MFSSASVFVLGQKKAMQNFIYENSVRSSQETHVASSFLLLFQQVIAVYSETRTKHKYTWCMIERFDIKTGAMYIYHFSE